MTEKNFFPGEQAASDSLDRPTRERGMPLRPGDYANEREQHPEEDKWLYRQQPESIRENIEILSRLDKLPGDLKEVETLIARQEAKVIAGRETVDEFMRSDEPWSEEKGRTEDVAFGNLMNARAELSWLIARQDQLKYVAGKKRKKEQHQEESDKSRADVIRDELKK